MLLAFNRPQPPAGGKDHTLTGFLLDAFESAVIGSKVWGSMYHWASEYFTKQLDSIRTARGLRLHIYAGNSRDDVPDKVKKFFDKLGVNGKAYEIDSDDMMNHTKWFLFEQLDWARLAAKRPAAVSGHLPVGTGPAVYLSSANITDGDDEKHNASVIVPVEQPLVNEFKGYYQEIKRGYVSASGEGTNVHVHALNANGTAGTKIDTRKWSEGWTQAKPFTIGSQLFLFLLKKEDGTVHIHGIEADGMVGGEVFRDKWTGGWTTAEFYQVGGTTYLFLLKKSGFADDGKNVHIHAMNSNGAVGAMIDGRKWSEGWTQAKPFTIGSQLFLFLLKEGDGTVHIHRIDRAVGDKVTVGDEVFRDKWTGGWTTAEFYQVGGTTYLFLLKKSGFADTTPHKKNQYRTVRAQLGTFYLYPRRPFKDPVLEILENIQHFGGPVSGSSCEVRIVTPRWRGSRKAVAQHLETLHRNGAVVEVMCRSHEDRFEKPKGDGKPELDSAIDDILVRCATRYFQAKDVHVHSKYLLIDAPFKQADGTYKRERFVWTGTQNLTPGAIDSHWEMVVKLHDGHGAYGLYLDDFRYLCANAARPPLAPGQR
jgi:hypothetical protein